MGRKKKSKVVLRVANKKGNRPPVPKLPVMVVQQKRKQKTFRQKFGGNGKSPAKKLGTNLLMGLGRAIGGPLMDIFQPVIEKGIDFLGTFTTGSSDNGIVGTAGVPGQLILTYTIAPRALAATRLNKQSELYQRFLFNEVVINYMPAVNVTNSGQLIGFYDTDPEDVVPTGIAGINYANSHGGKLFQISEPCSFNMPVIRDRTYYTDYTGAVDEDEERFKIQAVFYVMFVTACPATTALGSFSVKYNCSFELPQMTIGDPIGNSSTAFQASDAGSNWPAVFHSTTGKLFRDLMGASVQSKILPSGSSQYGLIFAMCGSAASTPGISLSSSPGVHSLLNGYYFLTFSIHTSLGNINFNTLSTQANLFTFVPAGVTITYFGNTHWSATLGSDIFFEVSFFISGLTSDVPNFTIDPSCTTDALGALGDFTISISYAATALVDARKHGESNMHYRLRKMQKQLDVLLPPKTEPLLGVPKLNSYFVKSEIGPPVSSKYKSPSQSEDWEMDEYMRDNDSDNGPKRQRRKNNGPIDPLLNGIENHYVQEHENDMVLERALELLALNNYIEQEIVPSEGYIGHSEKSEDV